MQSTNNNIYNMKNIILSFSSLLLGSVLFLAACDHTDEKDSKSQVVSQPQIAYKNASDAYVYGVGNTHIYSDLPDVIAVAVDTVYGFDGGYGGKTGADSVKINKTEIADWPDTNSVGAISIVLYKYNKGNYRVSTGTNIVIAGQNPNPGPTAMEGIYKRSSNGFAVEIKKVFDGVYVIDNPGGAAVAPFPYLLYNYKSSSGTDSLSFPNQANECGGGTQLVAPTAPAGLKASEYLKNYPPQISSLAPVTFKWKVFTYSTAKASATQPGDGVALCTWGSTAVRTFVKQ